MGNGITIAGYTMLACASATLYKAMELIIEKKPTVTIYTLLSLLLCIGYLQFSLGMFYAGLTVKLPAMLFTAGLCLFITTAYLAGPLAYLYYNALIRPRLARTILHLAPALAAALTGIIYTVTRPGEYMSEMHRNFFSAGHEMLMRFLMAGAVIFIVVYTSRILAIELSVRRSRSIRLALRWLIVITIGLLLSPVILFAGYINGSVGLSLSGAILLIIHNMLFLLGQARYRDFFIALGSEVRLARQRKSMRRRVDISALRKGLDRLMKEEKRYRDFNISIKALAEELSVTPHELSWYLNRKLRMDFSKYINTYRVEDAKRMLVENLEYNVLTVGFHVGFGSKTSFNVIFKEMTGMTPGSYRNERLKEIRDNS